MKVGIVHIRHSFLHFLLVFYQYPRRKTKVERRSGHYDCWTDKGNVWPHTSTRAHRRHHKVIWALFLWRSEVSSDTFSTKHHRYPLPVNQIGFHVKAVCFPWGLRLPEWNEWKSVPKGGCTDRRKKTDFPSSVYPGIITGNHKLESGWEMPLWSGVRNMNILSLSQIGQLCRCAYGSLWSPRVTLLLWIEPNT